MGGAKTLLAECAHFPFSISSFPILDDLGILKQVQNDGGWELFRFLRLLTLESCQRERNYDTIYKI